MKNPARTRAATRRLAAAALLAAVLAGGLVHHATAQTVSFDPSLSEPTTAEFTVDMRIDPGGLAVRGVHVTVSYDPTIVQLDGIDPGAWFTDEGAAGAAYFFHDFTQQAAAGTLTFDAAFLGFDRTAAGQLAACRFTALQPGESPLDHVAIDVRDGSNQALAFGHSTGDLIRIAASEFYFDPSISTPLTPTFTVDLAVRATGRQVKGAEIVVSYDPAIVQLDSLVAGSWVTGQTPSYYFYDFTGQAPAGELHCDLAFLDGTGTGDGVVAVCHFTALSSGISPLDFVSIDVRDDQNQTVPFGHSVGDRIVIEDAVSMQPASLSEVKALFR